MCISLRELPSVFHQGTCQMYLTDAPTKGISLDLPSESHHGAYQVYLTKVLPSVSN